MGILNWFGRKKDERALSGQSFFQCTSAEVISCGVDAEDSTLYINETTALQSSVFYGCANIIARTVATLSAGVYRPGDKGREKVKNHRVYRLFKNPSPLYTGFSWRQASQAQLCVYGDTVSFIENPFSDPQLTLMQPKSVRLEVRSGSPLYIIDGKAYSADQVLHIHGLSFDGVGINCLTPVAAAKRILGLSLFAEDFGRSFFSNDGQLGTTYVVPYKMKPEDKLQLQAAIERKHKGPKKAFKNTILDGGMTVQHDAIAPEQGQFLQTRQFTDKQIASQIFCMPPSMVGLEQSKSVEEEGIFFAQNTILPWLKNWEDEINRKLFTFEEQREGLYFEFNIDSLQRANLATRFNSYSVGRQIGLYSINQLAEKENEPAVEHHGDDHFVPLNWISTEMIKDVPKPNDPKNNPNTIEKMGHKQSTEERSDPQSFGNLIEDAARRVLTKESKAVQRAAKKFFKDASDPQGFRSWVEEFYSSHPDTIRKTFAPVIETMAGERASRVLDRYIDHHCLESRKELALAIWSDNPANQVEETIARWDQRAVMIVRQVIHLEENGRTT